MQLIYGPLMPVRVLEESTYWKQQEKRNTEVIRAAVPQLEPEYVQLLAQWEQVLSQTEAAAKAQLRTALQRPDALQPEQLQQLQELLRASVYQSEQFVQHLEAIKHSSQAVQLTEHAPVVLDHIAERSQYFLQAIKPVFYPAQEQGSSSPVRSSHNTEPPARIHSTDVNEPSSNWPPYPPYQHQQYPQHQQQQYSMQGIHAFIGNSRSSQFEHSEESDDESFVPIGGHKLPPLPYPYNALEPYIDEMTMRIHHDKHHKSYVDGLNKAETALAEARRTNKFELVKYWENELAFNGAGHYLHTIFWDVMSPQGGGRPTGPLLRQIEHDFGRYEAFRKQFTNAAEKVEGGGWTILVWSPRSRRLEILQAEKHQNLSQWDIIPLLPIDVWEHAYYLKHQNERPKYIADWWNVVNWPVVSDRFEQARTLKWTPF
ncbi:DUF2935 domain-containing protein [Paenibacillus alvei]|uniref:superoxide dismutase n=1 Tax=Paenibacillus alvei TaxID=44250 RepID=A0ABT4GVE8_PAEAL|nr:MULTISPECIES: Fe-Mn family superoxide dismutase [Paenibacillus]MCY7485605.1 DUF2935 domain-containing protein [Paenibacillus alvei]MCY9760679.1 DUF2935 domain-containing protein [Paenibacillus alvei]MCY9765942.1 DUF2935 domain-containing protein [Paenibacillus alvei]